MNKKLIIYAGVILGIAGAILIPFHVKQADASRNSSGTYSSPSGNFVTGTTISSSVMNGKLNDIGTEITNSLDRNGRGAMLNALQLYSGSVSTPGINFSSDSSSGLYRAGSHDLRMSINGADAQKWTTLGSTITGTITGTLGATFGGSGSTGDNSNVNVFSVVQPTYPAPDNTSNIPQGHDLVLRSRGSADLHLGTWSINLTSTTSVGSPGSVTVTVGSSSTICPGSSSSGCSTLTGSTANLCTPAYTCQLIVDEDTANEEYINSSNWSIAGSTSITATFANTHTQPFNIRQLGATFLDTRFVEVNTGDVSDRPIDFFDRNNDFPFLRLPNDIAGTWPLAGVAFKAALTGINGANKDLIVRTNTSSSCTKFRDSTNAANIAQVCQTTGPSGQLKVGNGTNSSLILEGQSDVGRIYGGGTVNSGAGGLTLYSSPGGSGSYGKVQIRNNSSNDYEYFQVNTASGGSITAFGNFEIQAGPHSGNPGDLTVANDANISGTLTASIATVTNTATAGGFHCTGATQCGSATLSAGGEATVTVVAGCKAICTNAIAARAIGCTVSGTTLSIVDATPTNDVVNWFCF